MKEFGLIAALLLGLVSVWAQPGQRGAEKEARIKEMRTKFFKHELQLTEKEEADFLPLYEAYEKARRALKAPFKEARKKMGLLSDAEVETYIQDWMAMEKAELTLKHDYIQQFREVLPVRKVIRIPHVEKQMKKELLNRLRERPRRDEEKGKQKQREKNKKK